MKIKKIIWIIIFLVIIATPHITYTFLTLYVDAGNHENRNLLEKPVLTLENYRDYPDLYNSFYGDNIPFRNQLIKLNNSLDYFIFKQSSNESVLIGEEGWLFYCNNDDWNPVEQSLGYTSFSDEELAMIAEKMKLCKKSFDFLGIEFIFLVPPNKESIYKDYIPAYYKRKNEISNAEQLINYLKENTDIRIVFPKDELLQARTDNDSILFYRKLDTHWSESGGYVGAVSLAKELGIDMLPIDKISCTPIYSDNGGLTDMLNITIKDGDIDYELDGYSNLHTDNEVWDFDTELIYHTKGADKRNLFVYRDSFSSALAPYIASQFENSYFVHRFNYEQQQIFDYNADIFVFETVERYIHVINAYNISYLSVGTEITAGRKKINISKIIPEDIELKYVSIFKINGETGEEEAIQILTPFEEDKCVSVSEEEYGQIVIYVFEDENGEILVNQTIAQY